MALLRLNRFLGIVLLAASLAAHAQDEEPVPDEKATRPPIAIIFTPPDLDGRIVLGIFGPDGRLVRTLQPQTADLKIDTNGYIAEWDGLDESGAACPSGRYSARGFVVGDKVGVEGEAYHFNDWMALDGLAVTAVRLGPWFGVELTIAGEPAPRLARIGDDGDMEFIPAGPGVEPVGSTAVADSNLPVKPIFQTPENQGSRWVIFQDGGQNVVSQIAAAGTALREFREPKGEPQPVEMVVAENGGAILLREIAGDVVRVRMLKKTDATATEGDKVVSDWEVMFERELEPCAQFGIRDGDAIAHGDLPPAPVVMLVPNVLHPKVQDLKVDGAKAGEGSALVAPEDGLILLPVSDRGGWDRFALIGGAGGKWTYFQGNGVVVEEFSVHDLDQIGAFDAGTFLLKSAAE